MGVQIFAPLQRPLPEDFSRLGGGSYHAAEVVDVEAFRRADLFEVVGAGDRFCFLPRLIQGRQQQRGEYGDHRYHNEQFNKSENSFHFCPPCVNRL